MSRQFRYSPELWPPARLPLPRVALSGAVRLDVDGWLHEGSRDRWIAPPPEMHLREMADVDPGDPESIREMTESTGAMLDYARPWAGVTGSKMFPSVAVQHHHAQVENVARQLNLPIPHWESRPPASTHVAEAATRLIYVSRLVDHVDQALAGRATAPGWQAAGFFSDTEFTESNDAMSEVLGERLLGDEEPETIAWFQFAAVLNDGLAGVHPRIVPPHLDSHPDMGDITDAYTAACVLIYNDLLDAIPYRRCADETCGRIFRHQIGRSAGSFSRTEGVTYCSPQHARSQSQRERRRRARAARAREGFENA